MGINLLIAVTDGDWFEMLRRQSDLSEVNFWAPSAANFRALQAGELFLFKLHAPRNVIVGGGIFAYANALPCSLAWEAFGETNGARSAQEMRTRIAKYRRADPDDRSDFAIGCRILTQPFFFDEPDWIPVPESWSPHIVSFKTYNPREGRQSASPIILPASEFRSTPPREGRRAGLGGLTCPRKFRSTPPREGRRLGFGFRTMGQGFDPRPHARGDKALAMAATVETVSIHAPTRGATRPIRGSRLARLFRSTPPREGRHSRVPYRRGFEMFRSTPPREGRLPPAGGI